MVQYEHQISVSGFSYPFLFTKIVRCQQSARKNKASRHEGYGEMIPEDVRWQYDGRLFLESETWGYGSKMLRD